MPDTPDQNDLWKGPPDPAEEPEKPKKPAEPKDGGAGTSATQAEGLHGPPAPTPSPVIQPQPLSPTHSAPKQPSEPASEPPPAEAPTSEPPDAAAAPSVPPSPPEPAPAPPSPVDPPEARALDRPFEPPPETPDGPAEAPPPEPGSPPQPSGLAPIGEDIPKDAAPSASARATALAVLGGVLRGRHPLDEVLARETSLVDLEQRDRAFVRALVSTTLRRLGQLDALIDYCLERPMRSGAAVVQDVLRLGVCQLLFLGVPAHAAVSESVDLAATAGHPRLKGLVNAVLRRLSKDGAALAHQQDAEKINTPEWLWQSWSKAYGDGICRAIAEANRREAPLDLSVVGDPSAWADGLGADELPTGTLRREAGGRIEDVPGFKEGAWWVQDAAAAIPARLFGELTGKTAVDLCAAPGGKTAQLAAAGAQVTAVDRSAPRLRVLEENLRRLNLEARTVTADGAIWRPPSPVDAVLIDAPCTATGTIRRHPDIPWLKSPSGLARLTRVQDRLIAAGVEMLEPNGMLVYCTCSLEPEEGPERIAALLGSGAPMVRVPLEPDDLGGLAQLISPDGDLRTLPCHLHDIGGMDGFYAARLRRT